MVSVQLYREREVTIIEMFSVMWVFYIMWEVPTY